MRVVDEHGAELARARQRGGHTAGAALLAAAPAVVRALRRSAPGVAGPAVGAALGSLGGELARLPLLTGEPRHPLRPAAVRIERAHSRGRRGSAEQTAVTVWFGEGPSLPSVAPGRSTAQTVLRIGAGLIGLAAVAAATGATARLAEDPRPPRITSPQR